MTPTEYVRVGHLILVIAGACYLAWWRAAFYPGADGHTLSGVKGLWFWLAALAGVGGVFMSAVGIHVLPENENLTVRDICLAGLVIYLLSVVVTVFGLRRPLTAELSLIVAWAGWETAVTQSLVAGGCLNTVDERLLPAAIALASIFGLIVYVLYYRLNDIRAFYYAMFPIIVDDFVMGMVVFFAG